MLDFLKNEMNKTLTENGAVTLRTSASFCVDLFATIGAIRNRSDDEIIERFIRAYTESPDTAMKILFYARDVRGGLGERRVFRTIMKWLGDNKPESALRNIELIAEYGRYDDLLSLMGTKCENQVVEYIRSSLDEDMRNLSEGNPVSLLAKWMPSVNATGKDTVNMAKHLAKKLGYSEAQYRKILSALRARIRIIENNLREMDYTFDYEKQPSKALFKYRAAFVRNDGERYRSFIGSVNKGEAKLNARTLAPYELVDSLINSSYYGRNLRNISKDEEDAINATWNALEDFGNDENSLPVIDTSGSMYWSNCPRPASVALSLGIYCAERNKGIFRNNFIEFSSRPQLIEIKGETFVDKLRYVSSFSEVADTNLEAVFAVILRAAVRNNVAQSELPTKLIIISDMEFNSCVCNAGISVFENAKQSFSRYGYKLPEVVFWNVDSRNTQQPVKYNEQGVALVSGCTPNLFSMVSSSNISPEKVMHDIINSERYAKIAA